jgi:hypothetical protein
MVKKILKIIGIVIVAFIALCVIIAIASPKTDEDKAVESDVQQLADDVFTDHLRKCTVMEASDIYTTGIGGDKNTSFEDGRKFCESQFASTYNNDKDKFIADVKIDWETRKNEVIEDNNLEHYLSILGW